MENRSSALDSSGTTLYNTVFVDTSLDTHLAMTISDSETVSNLKKKIMHEHSLCFPNIGGINIHALKVKRKGYFYHLSDSMFVKSAFDGVSKSWFLSVDASNLEELSGSKNSRKPNFGDTVACFGMTNNPSTEEKEKEKENDSGKRKRKQRSSKSISQVVAPTPSTKDYRGENSQDMVGVPKNLERDPDAAGVLGQGFQGAMASEPGFISMKENSCILVQEVGENNKVTNSSDVDMSVVDAVNVKSKSNSPEVAADSAVERVRVSEVLHTINAEGQSPIVVQEANNLNKDTWFSRNDNVIFNNGRKFDNDQIARVAEERELSNNNDSKAMLSTYTTSNRDEIGLNSKVVVTSDLFNASANGPSGKSSKKTKKSKKTRDPVASGTEHTTYSIIGISSTAPHKPAHKDHGSDKSRKDESILSPALGEEEVLKTMVNTSSLATVRETDNVIRHVLESLQDVRKNMVNVENGDEKFDSDQIAGEGEETKLSNNNDPNAMPLKCTTSNRDEIGMNSKVDVTSDLFNANTNGESRKSSKKRKKSKKTRDPVTSGTEHTTCSIIGISSTVLHEPALKDHSSDKSGKDESILSLVMGGEEVLKTTANTSGLATVRETDNVIQNMLESLQDVRKNSVDAETGDEKSRRKTKRKRSSASKSLPAMETEVDVNGKNATPSVNNIMDIEVDASPKLTKKTKLVKPSSKNLLNGSNGEPADNTAGIDANPDSINERRPLQDLYSDVPKSNSTVEANNHAEISGESDKTVVNDNFVPSQQKPDVVASDEMLVDKVIITKGTDNVVKGGKYKKRQDVHSNGPTPDLQTSLKFYENKGNGRRAQAFKSSSVDLLSLSRDDGDSLKLQSKTKLSKVSGIETRAPPSNKSDKFNKISEEATRANAVGAAGTHGHSNINKETVASSTSSLKSSKKFLPKSERGNGHQSHVDIRKVSNNNGNGEVVDGSKPTKSLLATSGAIFKDDSDGSCDEDGVDNSDNGTSTPSDNSLSSDYSDGGSFDRQNESYSSEIKKSARRSITKSCSGVKLDTILRRSSRFQAAMLTASESQLQDTESQPDEFVPDSQAMP